MTELSIHELSLGFSHDRQMLVEFLAKHHLNYEDDIEAAFGVFDSDENLTGCGCCAGNLLNALRWMRVSEDRMLSEVSCPDLSITGLRQVITISS